MKKYKMLSDEHGAVLPLVALFIFFVALGLAALVIDVGMMYSERRSMVAAADAGALAGAQELDGTKSLQDIINLSRNVAINNGADSGNFSIPIQIINSNRAKLDDGKMIIEVDKGDSNKYGKPYVEIITNKNTKHFFAKIFDDVETDIKALAVAGFNRVSFEEFVMPIGGIYSDFYKTVDGQDIKISNEPVYFHDRSPLLNKNNWSGLLDINPKKGQGKKEIENIIMDREVYPVAEFLNPTNNEDGSIDVDYYVDVANGWKNLKGSIQYLLDESAKISDPAKRKAYMTAYMPILQNVGSLLNNEGAVPIYILAEFIIVDYAESSKSWLSKNYNYTIDESGITVDYSTYINNKIIDPDTKAYLDLHDKADTIMGYFTGVTIDISEAYTGDVVVYLFK